MLSIAHGTTGAFIASKIPNPLISVPLVIVSHFIEDFVPHWDVGQGLTKAKKSKKAAFMEEILFDLPLSVLIVFFFFQYGKPFDWRPWLGWFCGLLPDFLEFPYLFLNLRFFPINQLAKLHAWVHRSTHRKLLGLLPQFIVIALIYFWK